MPCLHPSHRFTKVVDGPERAVVFVGSPADYEARTGEAQQPAQQAQQGQQGQQCTAAVPVAADKARLPAGERSCTGSDRGAGVTGSKAQGGDAEAAAADQLAVTVSGLAVGSNDQAVASRQGSGIDGHGESSPAAPSTSDACGGSGSGSGSRSNCSSSSGSSRSGSAAGLRWQLEEFLRTFPPSGASCRDLAWICAVRPRGKGGAGRPGEDQLQHIEVGELANGALLVRACWWLCSSRRMRRGEGVRWGHGAEGMHPLVAIGTPCSPL